MTERQISQPESGDHAALLQQAIWRKSSFSGTQGNCVEVAVNLPGVVAVRDSKRPGASVLIFSSTEWRGFVRRV
jgi:hypothetical protein